MDIAQYIADLLNEHNEVSLPGIGTFVKKHTSAYLKEGVFYPPSRKIEYRSEDGSAALLIQHIISVKHISESSAIYFIDRFIENLKENLKNEDSISLAPLGSLAATKEGLSFEASPDWSDTRYFGLPEVKEAKIIPQQNKTKAIVSESNDEHEPVLSEDEISGTSSKGWVNIFIIVLVAGAAALIYFYYSLYYQHPNTSKDKKPVTKVIAPVAKADSLKDSITFADSLVNALEKNGMPGSHVEKAPDSVSISSKATKPDSIIIKPHPAKLYDIVVASFGLKNEAQRYVKSLQKKGIEAKVIEDSKKPKFKVSIGTFTSSGAAHKENRRVQKEISKDSWVLTTNNQEK